MTLSLSSRSVSRFCCFLYCLTLFFFSYCAANEVAVSCNVLPSFVPTEKTVATMQRKQTLRVDWVFCQISLYSAIDIRDRPQPEPVLVF